jgi:uncharacterized protein (TIGR03437 family)
MVLTTEPIYSCGLTACTAVPLNLGSATDALVLQLEGTGIRGHGGLANVQAEIGRVPAVVQYAGPAPSPLPPLLDRVDLVVPHRLAGAGLVSVVLTVEGRTADPVYIDIQ